MKRDFSFVGWYVGGRGRSGCWALRDWTQRGTGERRRRHGQQSDRALEDDSLAEYRRRYHNAAHKHAEGSDRNL
jgi:hypothetical protein